MDLTTLYKIPVSVPDADVLVAMDAEAAAAGVPLEVWSTIRLSGIERYRMSKSLVGMHNIDGTFDNKTIEPGWEHQYPPTVVDTFNRVFPSMSQRSIYITGCEPWWTGANCFVIDGAASFALSLYHSAMRHNVALRDWTPEAHGGPKGYGANTLYIEWLSHCKAIRDTVARYKEDTQQKVNALWADARAFDRANKAPTFEQYKQDHEG